MFDANFCRIDRRSHLSHHEFMEQYGKPGKPVVILDIATEWRCLAEWDWGFFKRNYGAEVIEVVEKSSRSEKRITTWGAFIDYAVGDRQGEFPFYLENCCLEGRYRELRDYYTVPTFFENILTRIPENDRPEWSWLFIGPAGSGTELHSDTHDSSAWLLVIKGRKEWIMFPPEDKEHLSSVPLEDIKKLNLDFEKHSCLSLTHAIRYVQSPGEIVYTPSRWSHQVRNLEPCIALTENFVNETNIREFKSFLLNNGQQKHFDRMVQHLPELDC